MILYSEMGKPPKYAPWVSLAIGLINLFIPIRNKWMPGFLSMTGTRHSGDVVWFNFTIAAVCLITACLGFMRVRRPSAV